MRHEPDRVSRRSHTLRAPHAQGARRLRLTLKPHPGL